MTTRVDSEADKSAIGEFACAGRSALRVKDIGRLLLRCDDRPGLVAAVTTFLTQAGANIISLDQHSTEQTGGTFMQRTIFHLPGLTAARDALARDFAEQVAEKFGIDFRLTEAAKPKRVAIMASKEDHCLLDLLWRNRRGEFRHVGSDGDRQPPRPGRAGPPLRHAVHPHAATDEIRADAEQRQLDLLRGNVDLVVLARYMQILTPRFPRGNRLPGDQYPPLVPSGLHRRRPVPAGQAARGQAGRRHRSLRHRTTRRRADYRTGRRAGRSPSQRRGPGAPWRRRRACQLSRAVLWHCEDRIIRYGNQTVVF